MCIRILLKFCGGETDCVYQIENESPISMPFPLCFLGKHSSLLNLSRDYAMLCFLWLTADYSYALHYMCGRRQAQRRQVEVESILSAL